MEADRIIEYFVCEGCEKKKAFMNNVRRIGKEKDLMYVVKIPEKRYFLYSIDFKKEDPKFAVLFASFDFLSVMLKIFEKYEFAEYAVNQIRKAAFLKEELTDLFNSELWCDRIRLTSKEIMQKLEPYFEIIEGKNENELWCKLNVKNIMSMYELIES